MDLPSSFSIEPVGRSRDSARTSYDRLSRWYDFFSGSSEWRFTEKGLRLLAPQPGEAHLEIGCGTGKALTVLAGAVGAEGRVVAIDISGGMLAIAGKRLRASGLGDRVELVNSDALDGLPCDDHCYDGIFLSFFLDLVDTPQLHPFLKECRRVLKPGGRLVVVAMSSEGERGLISRLYRWAHRRYPHWIDCRPLPVRDLMESAGYTIDSRELGSIWGLPVEIVRGR